MPDPTVRQPRLKHSARILNASGAKIAHGKHGSLHQSLTEGRGDAFKEAHFFREGLVTDLGQPGMDS